MESFTSNLSLTESCQFREISASSLLFTELTEFFTECLYLCYENIEFSVLRPSAYR